MKEEILLFDSKASAFAPIENHIRNAAMPTHCSIPLLLDKRLYEPIVAVGDVVREGQILATCKGKLPLGMYSPLPGTITSLGHCFIGTEKVPTINVQFEGAFSILGKSIKSIAWRPLSSHELKQRALDCGVGNVCADLFDKQNNANVLVITACDPEPYLSRDRQLFHMYFQQILEGIEIAQRILAPKEIILVCSSSSKKILREMIAQDWKICFIDLFRDYIQLNSTALFRLLQKHGKRQRDDYTIISTSVAFDLFRAITLGIPVFERIISVAGEAIEKPAHMKVRVGTPIGNIIRECGGIKKNLPYFMMLNGTFTGRMIDESTPVTLDTTAILLLTEKHAHRAKQTPCIRCGACVRACPADLDPRMLVRMLETKRQELAIQHGMYNCIECGLCTFVCPSRIPLYEQLADGKQQGKLTIEQ